MTWASWIVRRTVSIIRPIPCESELTMPIAPSSWSGPSAAIVAGWTRSGTSSMSSATPNDAPWLRTIIGTCSAAALTPNGTVGVVDEHRMLASRTSPEQVGEVAAATPFDVIGMDGPAGDRGDGVLEFGRLVEAVGVQRDGHVVRVGEAEDVVDELGYAP